MRPRRARTSADAPKRSHEPRYTSWTPLAWTRTTFLGPATPTARPKHEVLRAGIRRQISVGSVSMAAITPTRRAPSTASWTSRARGTRACSHPSSPARAAARPLEHRRRRRRRRGNTARRSTCAGALGGKKLLCIFSRSPFRNRLYYFAMPSELCWLRWRTRCTAGASRGRGWTRLVLEKPFGSDAVSAGKCNTPPGQGVEEDRAYGARRIPGQGGDR